MLDSSTQKMHLSLQFVSCSAIHRLAEAAEHPISSVYFFGFIVDSEVNVHISLPHGCKVEFVLHWLSQTTSCTNKYNKSRTCNTVQLFMILVYLRLCSRDLKAAAKLFSMMHLLSPLQHCRE